MCAAVTSFSIRGKKGKIAPLEPTYKTEKNAVQWKPKFDGWNAILMAVNAKIFTQAEKSTENGDFGNPTDIPEETETRPKTRPVH